MAIMLSDSTASTRQIIEPTILAKGNDLYCQVILCKYNKWIAKAPNLFNFCPSQLRGRPLSPSVIPAW